MVVQPSMLYVVATPIGNLSDMTPRAVEVLAQVDMIAAEDTRHSRPLLAHFGIKTPLHSCHAFNEAGKAAFFVQALRAGKSVALISDAGTPCISDPGYLLIHAAAEAGFAVVSVCGASAVVAALSVSGFDASRFSFIGFFPRKKAQMEAQLQEIIHRGEPMVFYESPKRIIKTMQCFAAHAPDMQVCLCNDLTKKFERIYRGTPDEVAAQLSDNPAAEKGEYACVVNSAPTTHIPAELSTTISLEAQIVEIMVQQACDFKTAAAILHAQPPKLSKKEIYAATLRVKKLISV
ncbi:MAG: 16S rRNA (cytidine(1402)-2'-O)-methyltransferase [Defluviitaleaceae bacterium]|nr:16S rRNA (cytidine(1402)-2'-O)-methyltransferase [Defluviitaleaceae bacterium]